jgi:hypothetical protein
MIERQKRNLITILTMIFLTDSISLAQVKFCHDSIDVMQTGISYSTAKDINVFGFEFGLTKQGMAIGLQAAINTASRTTKSAGGYLEGSILKPNSFINMGIDIFFSYSALWTRGRGSYYNDQTYSGSSIIIGSELYSSIYDRTAFPFIQYSYSSSSVSQSGSKWNINEQSSDLSSLTLGVDILFGTKKKGSWLFTPGLSFTNIGHTTLAVRIAYIFYRQYDN